MIDDVSDIVEFYSSNHKDEHSRLERHQLEYDLTWRYLNQYLPAQGTILEVGAATGRYTLELARRGYSVTAADVSAALIEKCRKNLAHQGLERQVRLVVADARNLSKVTEKGFDAVLLMGPLYHLVVKADRELALKEALDRLRAGGVIFSSFISRFGAMGEFPKTAGRAPRGASIRSAEGHAWQHLHLRHSAAPVQVSGGVPVLAQGAERGAASAEFSDRHVTTRRS